MPHILLLEDDTEIRLGLEQHLRREGFSLTSVGTGRDALQALGFENLAQPRHRHASMPAHVNAAQERYESAHAPMAVASEAPHARARSSSPALSGPYLPVTTNFSGAAMRR